MDKFFDKKLIKKFKIKISEFTINDFILLLKSKNEKRNKENYCFKLKKLDDNLEKFFKSKRGIGFNIIFFSTFLIILSNFDFSISRLSKFTLNRLNSFDLRLLNKNQSQIAKIAKKVTVRIEGANRGSGIIIQQKGDRYTVLTAWHVIKDNYQNEQLKISTFDGKNHEWESMNRKKIGDFDLGIITFKTKDFYQTARFGEIKTIEIGNKVYVSGFPLETSSIPVRLLRIIEGRVIANTEFNIPDGYQLHYDNDTRTGMSGGGVFNEKGNLIAIHGRTEKNEANINFYGKVLSTGINMGIPVNHYQKFINKEYVEIKNNTLLKASDYLAKARTLVGKKGSEDMVISLAESALKVEKSAEAYEIIALVKYKLEDFDAALNNITKAIKINPFSSYYHFSRGDIKILLKEFKSAEEDFSKAIELDPRNSEYFYTRGLVRSKVFDHENAVNDFSKAIELDPGNPELYFARALSHDSLGNFRNSIKDYSTALELDPKNSKDYFYKIGIAKNHDGDNHGAISELTKSIGIFDAYSIYKRGLIKKKQGNLKSANRDFIRALFITEIFKLVSPNNDSLFGLRGDIKFELKDFNDSIKEYKRAINIEPQQIAHYFSLSDKYYQLGNIKGAINEINKIILINPNFAGGYFVRANLKYQLMNYESALEDYNQAIKINPNSRKTYWLRAYIKNELEDFEGSCQDYKKAIEMGFNLKKDQKITENFPILQINTKDISWCNNQ